jgi:hypothetical protein
MNSIARALLKVVTVTSIAACVIAIFGSAASAGTVTFSTITDVYYGTFGTQNIVEIETSIPASVPLPSGVPQALAMQLLYGQYGLSNDPQTSGESCPLFGPCVVVGTPIPHFVLTAIENSSSNYILGLNGNAGPPDPALGAFSQALGGVNITPSDLVQVDPPTIGISFNYAASYPTDCTSPCSLQYNELDNIEFYQVVTPLPAALPLFATGLGGLGLLGWRRKRRARAAA